MTTDSSHAETEREVLAAVQRWLVGTMSGDADALDRLLAPEYTYTHASNARVDSRADWLESFRTGRYPNSTMAAGLEDLFGQETPGEPDEAAGEFRRALVVAAHPDDADFGAGGTAALLVKAGWDVRYVIVTDGSKGSDDPSFTPERLVTTREEEQRVAAAYLGVGSVRFLGFTDGELVYSRVLLGAITRESSVSTPVLEYRADHCPAGNPRKCTLTPVYVPAVT